MNKQILELIDKHLSPEIDKFKAIKKETNQALLQLELQNLLTEASKYKRLKPLIDKVNKLVNEVTK